MSEIIKNLKFIFTYYINNACLSIECEEMARNTQEEIIKILRKEVAD